MRSFYIGMMSGTSMDGIEAVLVDFSNGELKQLDLIHHDFPKDLQCSLFDMLALKDISLLEFGKAHTYLGECYAKIVKDLLQKTKIPAKEIIAIGNHGQTIFHHPETPHPFTLQIGNNSVLAAETKITVVGDFRSLDMAYGGQGAPLAPIFHQAFLSVPQKTIAILNLGGTANVSILSDNKIIAAFDTGPGNGLMDQWMQQHFNKPYDKDGLEARRGKVNETLLAKFLQDPYFAKAPPKSSGREYFNLTKMPQNVDIATLTELTIRSILDALEPFKVDEIWACGGGAFNLFLLERLGAHSIANKGIHPQAIEPLAFAYLAKMRMENQRIDLNHITGSNTPLLLGQIFYP